MPKRIMYRDEENPYDLADQSYVVVQPSTTTEYRNEEKQLQVQDQTAIPITSEVPLTKNFDESSRRVNPIGLLGDLTMFGSTKLTATATSITISNLPIAGDTELFVYFHSITPSAGTAYDVVFNGDTGLNYARRFERAFGGAVGGASNEANLLLNSINATGFFGVFNIINKASYVKIINFMGHDTGAEDSASGEEHALLGKWNNTTDRISSIKIETSGGVTMGVNSSIIVYGRTI